MPRAVRRIPHAAPTADERGGNGNLFKDDERDSFGAEGKAVTVEANVTFGFPVFHIVGLADTAIKESKERYGRRSSMRERISPGRVIVNLSPADIRKEGTHFDLPLAVSVLTAGGRICEKKRAEGRKSAFSENWRWTDLWCL